MLTVLAKAVELEHVCFLSLGAGNADEMDQLEIGSLSLRILGHFLLHEKIESGKSVLFIVPPGIRESARSLCVSSGIAEASFAEISIMTERDQIAELIVGVRNHSSKVLEHLGILGTRGFSRIVLVHLADRIHDMPELVLENLGLVIPTTSRMLPAGCGYRLSLNDRIFKDLKYGCLSDLTPLLLVSSGNISGNMGRDVSEGRQEENVSRAIGFFSMLSSHGKPRVFCSKQVRMRNASARRIAHLASMKLGCRLHDADERVGKPEFPLLWRNEGLRLEKLYEEIHRTKSPAVLVLPAESFINLPSTIRFADPKPLRTFGELTCTAPAGKAVVMLCSPGHTACREFDPERE